MFLWVVVVVMAVALAGEIIALMGIALTISRAVRHSILVKNELTERLRASVRTAKVVAQAVRPDVERIRSNGAEIVTTARAEIRLIGNAWKDVSRRAQRLHLRFSREGVKTVEQLQRDRDVVSRGVLKPMRTAARVAMGVRATTWLLRKVA